MKAIQKRIEAQPDLVLGTLKAKACKKYNLNSLQALLLAQIIRGCLGGFIFIVIDRKKYYWLDLEKIAHCNLVTVRYLCEYIIAPLSGKYKKGVETILKPIIEWKRIGYNKWGLAFNKEPIRFLVDDRLLGDIQMLLDEEDVKDLTPEKKKPTKQITKGTAPKLNGYSEAVKNIYKYMLSKKLPDGSNLFRHPDLSVKAVSVAIQRLGDLRDGVFFDKIKIHDSFWRNGPNRRLEGVQGEINALAHGKPEAFEVGLKQAIDNYAEAFIEGKEPGDKNLLTHSMSNYFFNIGTQRSYFVYYFRFPADDMREKIADKRWDDMPPGIRKIADKIFRESMDASAFYNNIYRMYKRGFAVSKDYTSEISYWYQTPKELIQKFYDYILETLEFDPDTLTAKHFALKGKTFKSYLTHVRREYQDVTQEVVDWFLE